MTTKIRGMAYRAGSEPDEDPKGWILPTTARVTVCFNARPFALANVWQDENGSVHAEVVVPDDMMDLLNLYPYFAVSYLKRHPSELIQIAVTDCNEDPKLPPWFVVEQSTVTT